MASAVLATIGAMRANERSIRSAGPAALIVARVEAFPLEAPLPDGGYGSSMTRVPVRPDCPAGSRPRR